MRNGLTILLVAICGPTFCAEPTMTNMSKLLAVGGQLDQKYVVVAGYVCRGDSEPRGLFLTADDCSHENYSNGVGLKLAKNMKLPRNGLVHIEGIFNSKNDIVRTDDPYLFGEISVARAYF